MKLLKDNAGLDNAKGLIENPGDAMLMALEKRRDRLSNKVQVPTKDKIEQVQTEPEQNSYSNY